MRDRIPETNIIHKEKEHPVLFEKVNLSAVFETSLKSCAADLIMWFKSFLLSLSPNRQILSFHGTF